MNFIFVIDGSSYKPMYEQMLSDVMGCANVTIITDTPNPTKMKELLKKRKVRKLFRGKLDFLGYEENVLYRTLEELCPKSKQVVVIFLNAALKYNSYAAGTLKRYQKRWPNLKYVLYYLDIVDVHVSFDANYLAQEHMFDLIYTVDAEDARNYGMHHIHTCYSMDPEKAKIIPQIGMYFCGVSKNRQVTLGAIAEGCQTHGIPYKIDLVLYEECTELAKYEPSVNLLPAGSLLSYHQVLENELNSWCMLEIVQQGQKALTLRPYEAVCYNRKLLTNNKSILDFKFYDPAYMRYFEDPSQIDWDWVAEAVPVDYAYNGEFSPAWLLKDIQDRLEQI